MAEDGAKNPEVLEVHLIQDEEPVTIESKNPDLQELVKTIVKNADCVDIESIKVTSANPDFDSDMFRQALIESVKKFLEDLTLNEDKMKKVLESIDDE